MWGLAISATQCYANCRIVFRSVCCGCSEEQHREHFNPSRAGCVFSITPQDHHQRNHKDTKKMRDNRTENPHIHKHMAPMPHWFTVNVIKAFVMIRFPFPLTCFCPVCVRVCGSSGSRVAHLSLINSSPSSYITPVSPPLQRQINTTCMAICNAALWVCLII